MFESIIASCGGNCSKVLESRGQGHIFQAGSIASGLCKLVLATNAAMNEFLVVLHGRFDISADNPVQL